MTVETQTPPIEEQLAEIRTKLDALLEAREMDTSPWLAGDLAAARFMGYKSRQAFVAAMAKKGVRPIIEKGMNFWSRHKLVKAREQKY